MTIKKAVKLKLEHLAKIEPMTDTQRDVFQQYKNGYNLVLNGSAGTGKTFIAMALALEEALDRETPYEKVIIVRSIVPTRDIGFLPGDEEEKKDVYAAPYRAICKEILPGHGDSWERLVEQDAIEFLSTSFIRGITLNNAIIIVDEMQNMTEHELDSIITRVGRDCKFIMCGDYYQSDLKKSDEKYGIINFLDILRELKKFSVIEFSWPDIVRSGLVRDYIMTKEMRIKNGKV
jgi:predicted ribonuclease YlaK